MFKQILILISLILLIYFIYYFVSTHELFLDENIVKYVLCDSDRNYINKHETINLQNEKGRFVFYTNVRWSAKKNNYLKFKERYYIIEPGYYYYITELVELFINKPIKVHLIRYFD